MRKNRPIVGTFQKIRGRKRKTAIVRTQDYLPGTSFGNVNPYQSKHLFFPIDKRFNWSKVEINTLLCIRKSGKVFPISRGEG